MTRLHPAALALAACAVALSALPAAAQTAAAAAAQASAAASAATPADLNDPTDQTDLTEGEVRRIDRSGGKLTIRHGAIRKLDMPAMTMVFQVSDRAQLAALKVGDRLRFRASQTAGGALVASELRVLP